MSQATSPSSTLVGSDVAENAAATLSSAESPVHRTFAASFLSAVNLLLKVAASFILIPITMRYLGREQYGIWVVLQSFAGYLALSELGIGQTVCNFQNVAFARDEHDDINRILFTTLGIYCFVAMVAWSLFISFTLAAPVVQWLLKDPSYGNLVHFRACLLLTGTFVLLRIPLTVFPVTLMGLRQTFFRQVVDTAIAISGLISVLLTLSLGGRLLALIVVTNVVTAACMFLGYPLARYRHPEVTLKARYWSPQLIWPIFSNSLFFFLYGLGLLFQRIAGNLLAGKFTPIGDVPQFFVLVTLFRIVGWSLADILSQMLQPYVILLNTRREWGRIVSLAAFSTKFTFTLAATFAGLIWLFARVGIQSWLGPDMFPGYGILACLLASFLIDVLFVSTSNFMRALNHHRLLSVAMAAYAVLSFALGALGAARWFPREPIFGLSVGLLVASAAGQLFVMPFVTRSWLGIAWESYTWRFIVLPALAMACILMPIFLLNRPLAESNPVTAIVGTLVVGSVCFWMVLTREESQLASRLMRVLFSAG
jgi:O-antigen/teichoic acid export membrane protein